MHVKEGEYVGRICSHPRADSSTKFHWLKNDQWYSEGAQLKLASVKESDSGYYNCKASIPGSSGSRKTFIDVSCESLIFSISTFILFQVGYNVFKKE